MSDGTSGATVESGLLQRLRAVAARGGAPLFGVGDLEGVREHLLKMGFRGLELYTQVISFGAPIPRALVERLAVAGDYAACYSYRWYTREVLSYRIDNVALAIATGLEQAGYRALPVPCFGAADREGLTGLFSHNMGAFLAGIGWIGKSGLMVTPAYGPRVRLGSVLTNALLPAGRPLSGGCGACQLCVHACPAGCLRGVAFAPGQERGAQLDPYRCDQYRRARGEQQTGLRVCSMCLAVCPVGTARVPAPSGADSGQGAAP